MCFWNIVGFTYDTNLRGANSPYDTISEAELFPGVKGFL